MTPHKLTKAELWLLDYCQQSRTIDEIMYGELRALLKDRGLRLPRDYAAWWAYLRDITHRFLGEGYLQQSEEGKIVTVIEAFTLLHHF
jgi:hypothetical protein